jgi:hypothetical protein
MRKKLLALLMCATMVLGSSAVAFAADVTPTDVKNAGTIIDQYDGTAGAVEYEYDAKTSPVTFTSLYATKDNTTKVIYTYALTDSKTFVKSNDAGTKAYTKTNGVTAVISNTDQTNHALVVNADGTYTTSFTVNPSTDASVLDGAVLKGESGVLYYVTSTEKPAGTELGANDFVVASDSAALAKRDIPVQGDTSSKLILSAKATVLTLTSFTKSETGSVIVGTTALNSFGVDPDGYISKEDKTVTIVKYSNEVAAGYWVNITKAEGKDYEIAQALANGDITKNAVAVKIEFYNLKDDDDIEYTSGTPATVSATQTKMKKLNDVNFENSEIDVTFKTDWLSRSNAKNANTVYILNDTTSNKYADYFYNFGKVLKVSDLADEAFTTKYVVSGTYIFDYNEDASQNDGVSDTDTTATTTASTTAATSPKTGDVAPIAALAVVMMGACGAMVVASKKRA